MSAVKFQDYTAATIVDVRGVATAYRRGGNGEPTVFMHGAGLTRRWLPLYEALSADVDLIAPEHPGFGETALPDWMTDFVDLAAHYSDLFAVLGLESAHVVGHSFGGWVAAEFAALYPEKVRSLTLISPLGLRPPEGVEMLDLFRSAPDKAPALLLGEDAERWGPYFDEGDPVAQSIQDYTELATFARFTWNPRYDLKLEHRLRRVDSPTRIILPEHDAVVPLEAARRYADLVPNARVETLTGETARTEHLLILQEPQRLAAAIVNGITEKVA